MFSQIHSHIQKRFTRYITNSLLALSVVFLLVSCEDPTEIGLELQEKVPISTHFTDTLSIKTGTVLQDSMFTSGTEGVVLGAINDPIFGQVSSTAFFQLGIPVNQAGTAFAFDLPTDGYVYDSAAVTLQYNGFVYGDTLGSLDLSVHKLTEAINPLKRYIGSEKLAYQSVALGSKSFKLIDLRNLKGDTTKILKLPLNKDFGQELWNLANKTETSDVTKFIEYLKGLAIVPRPSSKMMANFKFSDATTIYSSVVLYCHEKDKTTAQKVAFGMGRIRFSSVSSSKNGISVQQQFPRGKVVSSTATNNLTYLQAGTGLVTRVEIPNLQFLKSLGKIAINKAELIVEPMANTYSADFAIPATIQVAETQKSSDLQVYRNSSGVAFVASNTGFSQSKLNYSINLTDYVQQIYSGNKTSNTLLLTIPTNDNTTRLVLDAKKTKLRLFYTILK